MTQRIGILGGTFDPVHNGHLRTAVELAEHFQLEALHLMPNHRPVHRGEPAATTAQRIDMLELATVGQPTLLVDDREARREKPSYTFDTLTAMHKDMPGAQFVFFVGADAFAQFDSWYRWQDLLELTAIVVVDRPGAFLGSWATEMLESRRQAGADNVLQHGHGAIETRSVTQLAISASYIRQQVSNGLSIRYLLPEPVREYIVDNKLYRQVR